MIAPSPHPKAHVAFMARLSPELKDRLMRCSITIEESQTAVVNTALREYFRLHPVPVTPMTDFIT